jgi:hypothetical protein
MKTFIAYAAASPPPQRSQCTVPNTARNDGRIGIRRFLGGSGGVFAVNFHARDYPALTDAGSIADLSLRRSRFLLLII